MHRLKKEDLKKATLSQYQWSVSVAYGRQETYWQDLTILYLLYQQKQKSTCSGALSTVTSFSSKRHVPFPGYISMLDSYIFELSCGFCLDLEKSIGKNKIHPKIGDVLVLVLPSCF